MEGREQSRAAMAASYQRSANLGQVAGAGDSRYLLHITGDRGVFIAEIDRVLGGPAGTTTVSLVQIFRVGDGRIALPLDYFAPAFVS